MNQPLPIRSPASGPIAAAEGMPRPKIMRRPAQFAKSMPATITHISAVSAPTHLADAAPLSIATSKSWQDDGRFAMTLLAIVIVVNLLVTAWLSAIKPAPSAAFYAPIAHATPAKGPANVHILDETADTESNQ